MAKKAAKKVVKKKATRVVKPPRKTVAKKTKDVFHAWRESKTVAVGLVSQGGAAYAALRRGKKWEYSKEPVLRARGEDSDPNRPKMFFDHHGVEVLGVFDIKEGALVVYQSAHRDHSACHVALGAALFEANELAWRETWRTELPIFEGNMPCGKGEDILSAGAVLKDDTIYIEWQSTKKDIYTYEFPQPFAHLYADPTRGAAITRYDGNPIISPNPHMDWEAVATLNPAAVIVDGKVHLFYRAIGHGGQSVFGHAVSEDGLHFSRFKEPSYVPGKPRVHKDRLRPKKYMIDLRCPTCGADGAEDPRATVIDGEIHILFAAFNGWQQARTAHISASTEGLDDNDLLWSSPTLLTAPPTHWGMGGKNAALLPVKIDDEYVILHRIWPDICIDYTPTLDMEEFGHANNRWLEAKERIRVRPAHWDSGKILVGAPPIETKDGWLLIYNAVSHQHNGGGYKIGAMLLDKQDPSRVLYRTKRPILDARAWYEETGHTPRVAYACGAVIKEGTLFVYYGGADTYVSVATADLDDFLVKLKGDSVGPQDFVVQHAKRAKAK